MESIEEKRTRRLRAREEISSQRGSPSPASAPRETSWRTLLDEEVDRTDGCRILRCTLVEDEPDRTFRRGLGVGAAIPFTAWSRTRVYFPVVYDGACWAGSAPRFSCDEATEPQGGGQ